MPTLDDVVLPPTVTVVPGGDLFEKGTAAFSLDGRYRYALTRQWDPTRPWLAYVMLNPSTADQDVTDPTITRCRNRARRLGAGGLLVLNLFAVRATDPRVMDNHPDPEGPDNNWVVGEYLRVLRPLVIVAWGAYRMVHRDGHDLGMMLLLDDAGVGVYRIGEPTRGGHPRHPLYLPSDLHLQTHRPLP